MSKLLIFLIPLIGLTQNCDDWVFNGNELKTDCGGDCEPCVQTLYNVYDNEDGTYNLILWLNSPRYYDIDSGEAIVEDLLVEDYRLTITLDFGEFIRLKVTEKGLFGDTIGSFVIDDPISCLGIEDSIVGTNKPKKFNVSYDVECDYENSEYFIHTSFIGGKPPYRIFDNDLGLYYAMHINSSHYSIGPISMFDTLDFTIYDKNDYSVTKNDLICDDPQLNNNFCEITDRAYTKLVNDTLFIKCKTGGISCLYTMEGNLVWYMAFLGDTIVNGWNIPKGAYLLETLTNTYCDTRQIIKE